MKSFYIACFVLASFACAVSGQEAVPERPLGFVYLDDARPKVVLEVFYDHLCDDSAASWPTLKQIESEYSGKQGLEILIHIFPLVNHHNAFFMQKAGEVVRNETRGDRNETDDAFVTFLEQAFKQQEEFLTGAVDMTEPQVQAKIAEFTETATKVSKEKVMAGFKSERVDTKSRNAWRYAASRGITGTPQYIINGVHDYDAVKLDFDGWKKMIDDLMTRPS
ncbi:PREDICTED: uncharacterized protein LOC105315512 [Amphimedon queenslandica]|uniref:Uncharacterized protein n=1 Tax=Amphimedon queenslandica TaxID=400682 RepID=A0A1X7SZV4_AMPQE|nr:PREDICTED: uncharacterized protein LOC105315512 [Amphimedon queenslandica]|eukprot:XP_019862027.1 PREDICTED: uncharacterized protein LOC105315512 [Amphimedon queenslandica]